MHNTILTADDFLDQKAGTRSKWITEIMKEFAAIHVKAALEAAAENVSMKKECGCKTESECHAMFCCDTVIDKESILDAYPENLIQ